MGGGRHILQKDSGQSTTLLELKSCCCLYNMQAHANHQHQLTSAQISEYRKAFSILDKDEDGVITTDDLSAAMLATGHKPTEAQLQQIVKSVDTGKGSGTMSFDGFQILMVRNVKKPKMDELRAVFGIMDLDHDGSITVEECRIGLKKFGYSDGEIKKRVKRKFKRSDFDRDGRITFEGS